MSIIAVPSVRRMNFVIESAAVRHQLNWADRRKCCATERLSTSSSSTPAEQMRECTRCRANRHQHPPTCSLLRRPTRCGSRKLLTSEGQAARPPLSAGAASESQAQRFASMLQAEGFDLPEPMQWHADQICSFCEAGSFEVRPPLANPSPPIKASRRHTFEWLSFHLSPLLRRAPPS